MGLQPTNRDENPAVGQALGLRRPLRPPGRAFHNLRWGFDCARVLQDPLLASRNQIGTGIKPPPWGRPSACGGLSGRPDELSITYGGFSTVHVSSRTRFWRLEISHPGTAGRRGRRPQGWSCPTRLLSPDSWLWLCLPVTPVPTPPRCTRPPHWLEWTFAQSATWHSSSETVSRKSTSP